jgi:hypothetical protein
MMPMCHLCKLRPPIAKPIAPKAKAHNTPLQHRTISPKVTAPIIEPIDMFQNLIGLFRQLLNFILSMLFTLKNKCRYPNLGIVTKNCSIIFQIPYLRCHSS